uniref:Uncharacterized protein n=1 Tax=Arundo donax TaxID=35708 RepID=A0A0A9FBG2_ARUDO
MNRYCSSPYI